MKRRYSWIVVAAALASAATVASAAAPPEAWSRQDVVDAERALGLDRGPPRRALRNEQRLPDGARGATIGISPPQRMQVKDPRFANVEDQRFHSIACIADAVVVARAESAAPVLTSRGDDILTRTRFQVVDVLKGGGGVAEANRIVVVRRGGEVIDAGEVLRVDNQAASPYTTDHTYLLFLRRAGASRFYTAQDANLPVRHSKVYPVTGEWESIKSGDGIDRVRGELARMATLAPCMP